MYENEKPIPDPRKLSWILYPRICHIVNLVGLEPATFQMCLPLRGLDDQRGLPDL